MTKKWRMYVDRLTFASALAVCLLILFNSQR